MKNGLSHSNGIYLAIHDPREMPVMEKEAILLGPRTDNYLAVSQTNLGRLKYPYKSDCRYSNGGIELGIFFPSL